MHFNMRLLMMFPFLTLIGNGALTSGNPLILLNGRPFKLLSGRNFQLLSSGS